MNNDRVYEAYQGHDVDAATRMLTRARIHWIVDHLPHGRVLDVGCSQGVTAMLLAERGDPVVGVDNERPALDFAEEMRSNLAPEARDRIELVEADAHGLPFDDASFDHAVCGEVLEHVDNPGRVVEEIFRVLVPAGMVLVTVPFGILPHPDHQRVFYADSLTRLLDPLFSVVELTRLEGRLGAVGERREKPKRRKSYRLSRDEQAFLEHERRLRSDLEQRQAGLDDAHRKYREVTSSADQLRDRAAELETQDQSTREELAAERHTANQLRDRERRLRSDLEQRQAELDDAHRKYRDVTSSGDQLRDRVTELETQDQSTREELAAERHTANQLRDRVTELETQDQSTRERLKETDAELRLARDEERSQRLANREQRRSVTSAQLDLVTAALARQVAALDAIEAQVPQIETSLEVARGRLEGSVTNGGGRVPVPAVRHAAHTVVVDDFERWRRRAAAAPGNAVVFMYSGTIHIQEKRGNRPIRLSRVYLERQCPVFFNYWRWRNSDPLPDYDEPLLFQSPVDVTPTLVDRLLEADFGGKQKLMFASFPHELMVRVLSRAAQRGWVTIYDARDDWEEFHKVDMAKWYDPGFEAYLVRHADVVTAVSAPLARKLREIGDRDALEVVPNGLDRAFPSASRPHEPPSPPVVGYFGHLTPKWFDWDLVIRAGHAHPDWRFELAGHQAPEDLKLPDNVKLLGLLGHAELAELSRRWTFAIIPFKVSALGEAVDPIKVYEYLHLGLPVLSSYMPQLRDYPGTVIAESSADFLALLPEMRGRRLDRDSVRSWLDQNTWDARVDRYGELAEGAVQTRAGMRALLARDVTERAPAKTSSSSEVGLA
jgi:ubiquinone/menaquinone biosynthesis C-methylase UbiE/glycosyltransferase involved in cell wall biosynthesis/uncharacterized protein YoxC